MLDLIYEFSLMFDLILFIQKSAKNIFSHASHLFFDECKKQGLFFAFIRFHRKVKIFTNKMNDHSFRRIFWGDGQKNSFFGQNLECSLKIQEPILLRKFGVTA